MIMQTKPRSLTTAKVPKRWTWFYQQLLQLREKLYHEQLTGALEPVELHGIDMADSATSEFDHDMTNCILSHEHDALYEVDAAIRRIMDGSYGLCEETGKPIPLARLRAVPWTRYTRAVEERLEQEGLIRRTRLSAVASIRRKPESGGLLQMDEPSREDMLTPEELRHERQTEVKAIENPEDGDDLFESSSFKP